MKKLLAIIIIISFSCKKVNDTSFAGITTPTSVGMLNVSPTPTTGAVTMSFLLSPNEKYALQVVDLQGKVYKSYGISSLSGELIKSDDFSQLPNGTYDLTLIKIDGTLTKTPLIIKK
jgi:hypothetical protein